MADVFSGVVQYEGSALAASDVLLTDQDGSVLAATIPDSAGRYRLDAPKGRAPAWVIARVFEPVIGVRAVAVQEARRIDFRIARTETVSLSGEVECPEGLEGSGFQVDLTPTQLAGFPTNSRPALFAVGAGPEMRTAFFSHIIPGSAFELRVLRGGYSLRVYRFMDGPKGSGKSNLLNSSILAPDSRIEPDRFGWWPVEATEDRRLRVLMQKDSQ
jgi:hypothetical protein